jgi:hypothetical protein
MTTDGDLIEVLQRWEDFGGFWQVISHASSSVVVSLCRCDGGEEVQPLSSSDPGLLIWLDGRTSSS